MNQFLINAIIEGIFFLMCIFMLVCVGVIRPGIRQKSHRKTYLNYLYLFFFASFSGQSFFSWD